MNLSRRSLISSILALGIAPAIVRVGSIMPVKSTLYESAHFSEKIFAINLQTKILLNEWYADRMETIFFNQITGTA